MYQKEPLCANLMCFDLDKEEYYSYNRRFSFKEWVYILSMWATVGTMWYVYDKSLAEQFQLLNMLIGLGAGILMFVILTIFDSWYAKQFPQHDKAEKYKYAKEVYDTIQEDIRKAKHKVEFEKKWAAKMEMEARLKKTRS